MTPYYDDGQVVIYLGDARDFVPRNTYQCVVTSPPYNVGIDYDTHDDTMPWDEYWKLARRVCRVMDRYLDETGRVWVNTAVSVPREQTAGGHHSRRTSKTRVLLNVEWAIHLQGIGLQLIEQVAWTSMRGSGTAWGSWQSPSSPNLRGDYEAITVACKGPWERTAPDGATPDTLGAWPELCTTVWPVRTAANTDHPATFPTEIAARCIRLSTWPGETVFDPFMGSGSTLVAAKQLGRRAIGVDISERYCEIAAKRLAQGTLDFAQTTEAAS
jgi:hypothetical protein